MKIRSLGLRRRSLSPPRRHAADHAARRKSSPALQSGVIDAAEFVGPGTDIALGLYRVAPFYYGPGFNKPNGTGECIVSLKAWNSLDAELKAIVAHACATEATFALAEMERLNTEALAALTGQHRVQLARVSGRRDRCGAPDQHRRAGRSRRTKRRSEESARLLHGVPRAHRGVVEDFAEGGAGGAGGLTIRPPEDDFGDGP